LKAEPTDPSGLWTWLPLMRDQEPPPTERYTPLSGGSVKVRNV